MSYLWVVRKTLISGALVPTKITQSTLYDVYCAREIENDASYEAYYASSYYITPWIVKSYVSDALLGVRRVRRFDAD